MQQDVCCTILSMFRQLSKQLFKLGTKKAVKEQVKLIEEENSEDKADSRSSSLGALASSVSLSSDNHNDHETMVALTNYSMVFGGISF